MRHKIVCLTIMILSLGTGRAGAAQDSVFGDFKAVIQELDAEKNHMEAIRLLEQAQGKFPGYEFELSDMLATQYLNAGQYDNCLETWKNGHFHGYFYLIDDRFPLFAPLADLKGFNRAMTMDKSLRKAAIEKSRTIFEIVLPDDFDPEQKYPLLMVLHGGGSTLAWAKKQWRSSILQSRYIVVFLQSYLHYNFNTFGWISSDPRARQEIAQCYAEIADSYPVDPSMVFVGGVSAGGSTAIDLVLNTEIPFRGFLGICPGMPAEFTDDSVEQAVQCGIRGIIISGETDFYRAKQEKMAQVFFTKELPYICTLIEGLGHGYPDDMDKYLNEAIKFLESASP